MCLDDLNLVLFIYLFTFCLTLSEVKMYCAKLPGLCFLSVTAHRQRVQT